MSNAINVRDAIRRLGTEADQSRLYRVLHIDRSADKVIAIEVCRRQRREAARREKGLSAHAKRDHRKRLNAGGRNDGLQEWTLSDVKAWLKAPTTELQKWRPDPRIMRGDDDLTPREKAIRDRDWQRIGALVTGPDADLLYDNSLRGDLIREHAEKIGTNRRALYRILRRYWEDGMVKNALLPDWVKTARPAHPRPVREQPRNSDLYGAVKNRKRAKSYRLTETDRVKFKQAYRAYILKDGDNKINSYHRMLAELYDAGVYNKETGKFKLYNHIQLHDLPSFRQFQYFLQTETDAVQTAKSRSRGTQFERNQRGLGGKPWQDIVGPTEEYQIDETATPVNLVSVAKPNVVLGTAWIVALIATWCQMVVGFLVSYRHPSMALTRDALLNAFMDKVEFCRRYGVAITEEEWPAHHVCQRIFPDRQSLLTNEAEESLTRGSLHIAIDMPPRARPDFKAYIERIFGHAKGKTQPEGDPAAYPAGGLELGERHPIFRATETIEEFTRKLIVIILDFNKNHEVEPARLTKAMLRDGVRPRPLDLWSWGLKNAPTSPLSYTDDEIYFGLLPEGDAAIEENGIWFGLPGAKTRHCYTCERATKEQWFARARITNGWRLPVLYDRLRANYIWLKRGDGTLERCTLMSWEEAARDMRLDEITDVQDAHFEPTPEEKRQRLEGEIGIARTNAEIAQRARARRKAAGKGPSDRNAKKALAKNRAAEIEAEINERNERLDRMQGIETKPKTELAKVIPLFDPPDDLDLIANIMKESQPNKE